MKKSFNLRIPEDLLKQFKGLAVEADVNVSEFILSLVILGETLLDFENYTNNKMVTEDPEFISLFKARVLEYGFDIKKYI